MSASSDIDPLFAVRQALAERSVATCVLRVVPRAACTQIVGVLDDGSIKVRVAAPPEGGKANVALARFLAELLGVPKTSVRIVAGAAEQRKLVQVRVG